MKIAVIDIGTNSTRLLIVEYKQGCITPQYSDLEITRIGEGVGESRLIKPQALQRTINCLRKFVEICHQYSASIIRVVATSAVRDAENKTLVIKEILKETGLYLEPLTGAEEAKLSYLGAISDTKEDNKVSIVLDIGGGSTELVYPNRRGIQYKSVNLGAVRLTEQPKLMDEVQDILGGLLENELPEDFNLIGVGGTITTLIAIKLKLDKYEPELVHGQILQFKEVEEIGGLLFSLSLEERKKLKGLQPERADIIPYGTFILQELMKKLQCDKLIVSEKDILYGMIIT